MSELIPVGVRKIEFVPVLTMVIISNFFGCFGRSNAHEWIDLSTGNGLMSDANCIGYMTRLRRLCRKSESPIPSSEGHTWNYTHAKLFTMEMTENSLLGA
jgi:hypothetical protein